MSPEAEPGFLLTCDSPAGIAADALSAVAPNVSRDGTALQHLELTQARVLQNRAEVAGQRMRDLAAAVSTAREKQARQTRVI